MSDATLQHIAMLAAKRERLLLAQIEAEAQYLHTVARDYKAGEYDEIDLAHVYVRYRDASATPGHSKHWNEHVPVSANRLDRVARSFPPSHDRGTWRGEFPLTHETSAPFRGVPVVYLLFDADNVPCYVGSTAQLRSRMRQHARSGKAFTTWQAHACDDRADAYRVEREWLIQYKPYLNKRAA